MFKQQWKPRVKPRVPFNVVVANGSNSGAGGGGDGASANNNGDTQDPNSEDEQRSAMNRISSDVNAFVRGDRLERREKQQAFFKRRITLDQKRRKLAEGNIVQFELKASSDIRSDKKSILNRMLSTCGFKKDEIVSVKINEFIGSKLEVLFQEDVIVDCLALEAKLHKKGFNVEVCKYDLMDEVIDIIGLPLTSNMEQLKADIRNAIAPFVMKVSEIKALTYIGDYMENDYFHGHFDGNYRVTVVPFVDKQVPMYLVVGKEQAMAKAEYHRKNSEKVQMCNDCFSTEHLNFDESCEGIKPWDDYIKEFSIMWQEASESHNVHDVSHFLNERERSRVQDNDRMQLKNNELQDKVAALTAEKDSVVEENLKLNSTMKSMEERVTQLTKALNATFDLDKDLDNSSTMDSLEFVSSEENTANDDSLMNQEPKSDPFKASESHQKRDRDSPPQSEQSKKVNLDLPKVDDWISFVNENGSKQNARVVNIGDETIILQVKSGNKKNLREIELFLNTLDWVHANGPFWSIS